MNKVILIGNLTRDPENSETPSGVSVCKMSMAVNRTFTNANGERECDYFNIVAWRQLADNCGKYLSKGKKIAIVGNLQTRSYETKEGDRRYVTEVIADEVEFLSPRDEQQNSTPEVPERKPQQASMLGDDDLPF